MDVEQVRHVGLDRAQELQDSLPRCRGAAVPTMRIADDFAGRDVQRREQCRRSMTHVVVSASRGHARRQRQHRLCAVEGLDLTLFVLAQHIAIIGGFMYRPTISRTFSTKVGWVDSLKVSWDPVAARRRASQLRSSTNFYIATLI